MPNYLTTTIASGISGSFTALQDLQKASNQGAVIDLDLNKQLAELTNAEIQAQLNFTNAEASNQYKQGWFQAAGLIGDGAFSLVGIGVGDKLSPSEPVEEQPMKVNIEEVNPVSALPASEEEAALEPRSSPDLSPVDEPSTTTDPKVAAEEKAVVEASNNEEASAANATKEDEEAAKAKAAKKLAKAKSTWQNQCAAVQTRWNTYGTSIGKFTTAAFTVPASYQQSAATQNQGYATLAGGGLQNIQTTQGTINNAMELQRGQASAAAQAEISIIQAGHPIQG